LERRAANAKKQREAETRRIAKLEKERKRKEREKKKADAAAREAKKKQKVEQKKADDASKKAAEAKKQAEQLAKQRKLEEEKLKKAEQKRKADAEAARQKALAEQMMQEQLAAEAAARNRAKQAQVLSEVEKYTALITAKIQQNLLFDENMKGKECRLNLRLAFNGLVTNVEQLSGDKQVCDAAIRAVRRVETLPVSKDKAVFEELKNINLTIQPDI
jgi:colicin import membrane protein